MDWEDKLMTHIVNLAKRLKKEDIEDPGDKIKRVVEDSIQEFEEAKSNPGNPRKCWWY